eukprot:TRINITY_DN17570_c0_g1_i1.p1 TRINITY_DN17570_c0_g1~~TRINITY_DN17570_c0_g1_i1.p1  ORF type:complete len:267 (-),score=43.34 TRINITY_DN17570_c0_g1_i1:98-898(-)
MVLAFVKTISQNRMVIQSVLGLLCLSCVLAADEPCQSALDNGKINPVSKPSGDTWIVDPFIIPPKGTCKQMPVDDEGKYLNMDFDAYPNITAQCDDKIKFVMRTVSRQQRHGVYLTEFTGDVTADSWPPCPPPVFNDEKMCDVRLNESDQKDTQCQGYTQLYPLLMFGPDDTVIKEYTTPTLRTMVVAGEDTDVLVFTCPWIKGQRGTSGIYTSHCDNGMFVKVTVQGCKTNSTGETDWTGNAASVGANAALLFVAFAATVIQHLG